MIARTRQDVQDAVSGMGSLFAVTLGILLAASGCGRKDTSTEERKPAATAIVREVMFSADEVKHGGVRWAPVESKTMTTSVEVPGRLTANEDHTARLSAPARGRLVAVRVNVGDRVASGQPLVTLQSQDAAAAQADATKAAAELNSRQTALNYARTARERAERLLEAKATSRQEVERAQADEDLAKAALEQARAEVDRAKTVLTEFSIDGPAGQMVLRSPLAGVVLSREAVPGSVVDAGAPLVVVTDASTLWLEMSVSDRVAVAIQPGAEVRFTVPAFTADTFVARVRNVAGALDPTTRALPIRALVSNPSGRLRAEMFATVRIDTGTPLAGVEVREGAIQLLDQRSVVFVAQPDAKGGARFERRDVEIGAKIGDRVQVLEGLKPGDVIVVEGAFSVKSQFSRSKMPSEG